MDYSFVCLIPKKKEASLASEFRPIGLINGAQKIISKVLANILESVMKDIISPCQAAFLKGRVIMDSFVTASQVVKWYSKVGLESVGIKADFEKAFDRVNWDFLRLVLKWLGANHKLCGWIEQCISNAKKAIHVNGVPTKWIKTTRGLRQGDPISLFLFLLVAEWMARITERDVSNNLLEGVGPNENSKVSIIQYADDTIFFCGAKSKQARNLLFIWQLFEWD